MSSLAHGKDEQVGRVLDVCQRRQATENESREKERKECKGKERDIKEKKWGKQRKAKNANLNAPKEKQRLTALVGGSERNREIWTTALVTDLDHRQFLFEFGDWH